MKLFSVAALTVLVLTSLAPAQIRPVSGKVFTPDSSIAKPSDLGKRAHTNIRVFPPSKPLRNAQPFGPPFSGTFLLAKAVGALRSGSGLS